MNLVLLSALILASTASVRSSKAEQASQNNLDETQQAVSILNQACSGGPEAGGSAALAAERLRYDEGLISCLSTDGAKTKQQRLDDAFAAAKRRTEHAFVFDWASWEKTLLRFRPGVYDSYAQNQQAFSTLADSMNEAIQAVSADCVKTLSRDLRAADIPMVSSVRRQTKLGWRQCAALYYSYGEGLTNILADSFSVTEEGSAYKSITVRWPDPDFDMIASCGTREQHVEAKLALYYFNTVYLDDGSVAPVGTYTFSKEYLATVIHPVPDGTIKNGWYDPRSHRTRLHVGTDIRMPAKTPIVSVTDGVVLQIGYLPIPGNYVIIRDPYGYEYHYYHMYELSTFVEEGDAVKQGQQIGRVGSTGNSVAYHLHLGIVSPEGVYLNPYDLFVQAGIGPIQEDSSGQASQ